MDKRTTPPIVFLVATLLLGVVIYAGCREQSSDDIQQRQQETILQEATNAVGMPAIKNFHERRLAKMILELRDQTNLSTYTYLWSEYGGRWVFFCSSIGYGIPYALQYTNPQKLEHWAGSSYYTMPQADPNGLFSPESAEGTWIMCKNPKGADVRPVYVEPRVLVSPFELETPAVEVPVVVGADAGKKSK